MNSGIKACWQDCLNNSFQDGKNDLCLDIEKQDIYCYQCKKYFQEFSMSELDEDEMDFKQKVSNLKRLYNYNIKN